MENDHARLNRPSYPPPVRHEDLLEGAESDYQFMATNEHKTDRERWVLDQWLVARERHDVVVADGGDPPDFLVDGEGVEVVEAMPPGRRRSDEYREKLSDAQRGRLNHRWLPSLGQVKRRGHEWIFRQVQKKCAKHYDPTEAKQWTLLVYANFGWMDHVQWELLEQMSTQEVPPFAAVEVVYELSAGSVVRQVYVAGHSG